MVNPVQLTTSQPDGTTRKIIIEPVLDEDLQNTGTYKIFKDAFGDETVLFTEPREAAEANDMLDDNLNPDYLGRFVVTGTQWHYEGDLLTAEEQQQVAGHLHSA